MLELKLSKGSFRDGRICVCSIHSAWHFTVTNNRYAHVDNLQCLLPTAWNRRNNTSPTVQKEPSKDYLTKPSPSPLKAGPIMSTLDMRTLRHWKGGNFFMAKQLIGTRMRVFRFYHLLPLAHSQGQTDTSMHYGVAFLTFIAYIIKKNRYEKTWMPLPPKKKK